MTKLHSASEARNTKIFVIENGEVVKTTLFDHVTESAEETTIPRGVMRKLFIDEQSGLVYQHIGSKEVIDQYQYDALSEEDQGNYYYFGETTIRWELREWMPNGKSRLVDTYESQEAADDEWYTRTYNYDFTTDDQRDTSFWLTKVEAEAELNDRVSNQ